MAGIEVAKGEHCGNSTKNQKVKVALGRIIWWWIINPAMMAVLYFALYQEILWCQNLVKFTVWLNFVIWGLILLAGDKGQKPIREKGFPVNETTNGVFGLLFAGALACFGWFGYAGMEITTLISQQITYFGDDK
jgi:hypothetical protein